ncbi:hypothetical protein [Ruegeria sp. Ofav3-42]|nr:hypothetical protein [Ruegeria sp. Ofav3-42]MCG7519394.1 hypothetical protein [Ruegeria sp. Ofav3-42]
METGFQQFGQGRTPSGNPTLTKSPGTMLPVPGAKTHIGGVLRAGV